MSTVKEIKQAILKLPKSKFDALGQWFDRQRETEFDRQIAEDAKSGRLDALYRQSQADSKGKPDLSLDEFLRHRRVS